MENRRIYKRYKMKEEINKSLLYYDVITKTYKKGVLLEISQQGLSFKSNSENLSKILKIGDYVYVVLNFILKVKTIITIEIRWIKEDSCGGLIVNKQTKRA